MGELMGPSLKTVNASNVQSFANITRIFFASSFHSSVTADSISTAFSVARKTIEQKEGGDIVEKITGGCIITSNAAVLGFIEAKVSLVCKLLTELQSKDVLKDTRVLSVSQNCPVREFENWGVYSSNPPSEDIDVAAEGANNVAQDIFTKVINAAGDLTDNSSSNKITSLSKTLSLPSSSNLIACSKSSEFPSLQEYMELFGDQVVVENASEKAWPLQNVVMYDE